MKILVFGSMNIDKVYSMPHLPEKGETLSCTSYELHVGGKGLNQAISCKKAGNSVYMAGKIGEDGLFLKEYLNGFGVDTSLVMMSPGFTGHAVIEIDRDGQNQMILFPGANREITQAECDLMLSGFDKGDMVLMQYETSCVSYMLNKAHEKGCITAFNPSPFVEELKNLPYEAVDYLILNEEEGLRLSETNHPQAAVKALTQKIGKAVILTLGASGAIYADKSQTVQVPAFTVNAVDTTGAGDTFTGYVLTALLNGISPKAALIKASAASALAVTQKGAAQTIPEKNQVEQFLAEHS